MSELTVWVARDSTGLRLFLKEPHLEDRPVKRGDKMWLGKRKRHMGWPKTKT